MATPKTAMWELSAHSEIKHKILANYLKAWFPILGATNPKLNYVDGFAGPGIYKNGEKGSPIVALEIARIYKEKYKGTVNFLFIEQNKKRSEQLNQEVNNLKLPEIFRTQIINDDFKNVIGGILDNLENSNNSLAPSFFFVDPFGFSGIPFNIIKRILKYKKVELCINFMIDPIKRFANEERSKEEIEELFGLKNIAQLLINSLNKSETLTNLYNSQLQREANAKYVAKFLMLDKRNKPIYYLFFASNDPLGFVKMKEAMWKIDEDGTFKFSDADNINQLKLYKSDHGINLFEIINQRAREKNKTKVNVSDIKTFVENETIYITKHLKQALKYAEQNKLVDVDVLKANGDKRINGTFPAGVMINFKND